MKSRWLAVAVAMAVFSAVPWTLAQNPNPDEDKDQPKAGDVKNAPKQPPAALPTADDSQVKHDGGKHDVDAVGNRNVGCGRGVGNWYTVEGQVARGRVYAQQIESQVKLVNDPVVTEYVNRIGQKLYDLCVRRGQGLLEASARDPERKDAVEAQAAFETGETLLAAEVARLRGEDVVHRTDT